MQISESILFFSLLTKSANIYASALHIKKLRERLRVFDRMICCISEVLLDDMSRQRSVFDETVALDQYTITIDKMLLNKMYHRMKC